MNSIINSFPISNEEYEELENQFVKLSHYQSWQLKKRNANNNVLDDEEDVFQNVRIAMLRAGSYHKRQVYIESCFASLKGRVSDGFARSVLRRLRYLWKNKTRHGANRQKFGPHQEDILYRMVKKLVPVRARPDRTRPLEIDNVFKTYCKTITWNENELLGKKITREKSWRTGLVSLSEFDYLSGMGNDFGYILD